MESDPTVLPGEPQWSHYWPMMTYLQYRGWKVVAPTGDWRRPQTFDANLLYEYILELEDEWPLVVVCHSRGGLILRRALAKLWATGNGRAVLRVVGFGVPHAGSMNAVSLLAGFHSLLKTLIDIGEVLGSWLFSGLLPQVIYDVVRSWPGVYELLPAPGAKWVKGTTVEALYSPSTYAGSPLEPISALLAAAYKQWADVPPIPSGVEWIHAYGYGVNTPVGLEAEGPVTEVGDLKFAKSGDGTVQSDSACPDGRAWMSFPCVHDMLLCDGRVYGATHTALYGKFGTEPYIVGGSVTRIS